MIRDEGGRILLHRRADDGAWSLPAGAIEPGETPTDAVAREVWEETRLRVRADRLLGAFGGADFRHIYPNGDRVEYIALVFACRVHGGALAALDGEATAFRYFDPAAMPPLHPAYPSAVFRNGTDTPLVN